MKYQLIVSDFDDTLRCDDGGVSSENCEAIQMYLAAGGKFVICTGRMFCSIRKEAQKLGLTGLIAAYQGGMVADIETGRIYRNEYMQECDAVQQLKELEQRKIHSHLYYEDRLYVQAYDDYAKFYEQVTGIACHITNQPLSEYAAKHHYRAHKIVGIAEEALIECTRQQLAKQYPHLLFVKSKPIFIEIMTPQITKAHALIFMADQFKIPIDKVIAVGDSLNDYHMIQAAGLGIAVKNAMPELKQAADLVLDVTNNQHAIKKVIEIAMQQS